MDQEQAYQRIESLVTKFKNLSPSEFRKMNEMQTRLGYILPMFAALGWDISNINEVSPEEKVSRGFVDFAFRIHGIPRYFLETKKVSENINDPRWVRQSIDYAWMKSVAWALLSDFEGLRVFNAEWKEDNPFKAQFFEFNIDSYLTDFDRLWWLSREETLVGRLNQEAEKVGKKMKREPVSQHLFDDLKRWRTLLFKDLVGYNMIGPADADNAVLRLLNRLVFIRTAEDRQVEPPRLQSLMRELRDNKKISELSKALSGLFREMDSSYNSELFAPHFSEGLYITPSVIEEVILGMYERNFVRYNFNAIDADVLGTVYEQYLGAVITTKTESSADLKNPSALPGKENLTVEDRRKKKKSQGIYYTPAYITRYIVQQTVGRHLEAHSYNPSRPPRVLDMACGSGSFLIEAFDVIDRFVMNLRGQHKGSSEPSDIADIFDHARQLEVLTNCIYGVDKDKQAVDVARLNLLLRALHSREKLPMLENIYNGDSLQPETWELAFPQVMKEGGFDVIIGNPPYVRQETLGEEFKSLAQAQFETYAGTADLYVYFIEQAHKLLKPGGWFGMIVSNKWMRSHYGKALRKFLTGKSSLVQIIDFGELPVFKNAATFPIILITNNSPAQNQQFLYATIKRLDFVTLPEEIRISESIFDSSALGNGNWTLSSSDKQKILHKMEKTGVLLEKYTFGKVYFGIKTGLNDAFIIKQNKYDNIVNLEPQSLEFLKPFVMGDDVRKYYVNNKNSYLIRIPKGWTNSQITPKLNAWEWFAQNHPLIAMHLEKYEELAKKRTDKGDYWWELRACDYYEEFEKPKIVYPDIAKITQPFFCKFESEIPTVL